MSDWEPSTCSAEELRRIRVRSALACSALHPTVDAEDRDTLLALVDDLIEHGEEREKELKASEERCDELESDDEQDDTRSALREELAELREQYAALAVERNDLAAKVAQLEAAETHLRSVAATCEAAARMLAGQPAKVARAKPRARKQTTKGARP